MNYYLEIRLRPDPEFSPQILMNALISKLHRALVSLRSDDIGVSFPEYQLSPRQLGERLRIHGTETRLRQLMDSGWLAGMSDHAEKTDVLLAPESGEYCLVRRRQVKSNVERLRRRRMKRKGGSYEEAVVAIPAEVERKSKLPFATLNSRSSGEVFKLLVDQQVSFKEPRNGDFNAYGLSHGATVPWFE